MAKAITPTPEATAPQATVTPKQLAIDLGTDGKTARRFLRSIIAPENRPGKGGRWSIDAAMVETLAVRFDEYRNRKATTVTADDLATDEA